MEPVRCTPQAFPIEDLDRTPARPDEPLPFQLVKCDSDAGTLDAQQQRQKLVGISL